jgi:hypothetical protein
MGGLDVSAPRSSSAPVSGLVPGHVQSSPGFALPSKLCPVWSFRMAGGPGLGEGRILGSRTLHGFCEGCGFFFLAKHAAREDKDRSESASGKGRIEDQETRTLEHHKGAAPKVQKRSKAGPPTRAPIYFWHRTAINLMVSKRDIINREVRDALRGIAPSASASGKEGEANEISRSRNIPAQALKAHLQRMWQAFR